MLTYTAVRSSTFSRLKTPAARQAAAFPQQADLVLKACLKVAGGMKAHVAVRSQNRFKSEVRRALGLPGILSGWLSSWLLGAGKAILLQLLADILPAVIAWLTEQLGSLVTSMRGDQASPIDAACLRLAEEGE